MAVRALIPAERLHIAHVNSVDGSTDYESGVEYKAGCVVTYNSNTYVANIDIEDTDTDTPDAAPDKWGLCPNAKSLVEGGEVADLENRVAALENTVGDEDSGLVKDVDDLQLALGAVQFTDDLELIITADGVKDWETILTEIHAGMKDIIAALEDDEYIYPYRFTIYGTLSAIPKLFTYKKGDSFALAAYNWVISTGSPNEVSIFMFTTTDANVRYLYSSTTTSGTTVTSRNSLVPANGVKIGVPYFKFKKLS